MLDTEELNQENNWTRNKKWRSTGEVLELLGMEREYNVASDSEKEHIMMTAQV